MHPDNNPIDLSGGTLFIIDPDTGEGTPLGTVTDIHETIVPDPISPEAVQWINKSPEATFTIRMHAKKMSRKRFVKKLMGYCVSRNKANAVAAIARERGDSYAWAYMVICFNVITIWEESLGLKSKEE